MNRRATSPLLTVLLALGAAAPPGIASASADGGKPRIEGLEVSREGSGLRVSFRLVNGLSEDALERIHSSLPVTYRHSVELVSRRAIPLWPPRVVARARVETTARYDSLTRQYDLARRIEITDDQSSIAEERATTDSTEEMRSWMTEMGVMPWLELPSDLDRQRLRLRVRSSLGRRYMFYLIPTRLAVSAERKLEP